MGTPQYTLNSSKLWQSQGTEEVKHIQVQGCLRPVQGCIHTVLANGCFSYKEYRLYVNFMVYTLHNVQIIGRQLPACIVLLQCVIGYVCLSVAVGSFFA